jgi:hypothetical protein
MKKRVGRWRLAVGGRMAVRAWFAVVALFLPTGNGQLPTARATPTQEDVFRSLSQNMQQTPDYSLVLPFLFAVAGVVVVVIFLRQRQKNQANPKALNHPGKLVREISKLAAIDPAEMKRLRGLAQQYECENPLTLLLCPSILGKGQEQQTPADNSTPGAQG